VQRCIWGFVEQPLAMVLGRKALGEPLGEAPCPPAIRMENRVPGDVVADAMPVERGLATDVQTLEASLQQREARVQGRGIIRAGVDATRQPLEPARPDIVNGKIR
jgi:hypothetical protein